MSVRTEVRVIRFSTLLAASLAAFITVAGAHGQCEPEWLPGSEIPGVNGYVNAATVWDADGAGPAPSLVVAAGTFTFAGTTSALNIAAWDPAAAHWIALGGGVISEIRDMAVVPNTSGGHDLLVATEFGVERWNGSAWSTVGAD